MERVSFKSKPEYFQKEKDGRKPNTIRIVAMEDERVQALKKGEPKTITIYNAENQSDFFTREITDISFWNGNCIISWRHKED